MKMQMHAGKSSYIVESDRTCARITECGGHVTAEFRLGEKIVDPFFVAPWWGEGRQELAGTCDDPLRGIFFCFPFGMSGNYGGINRPCHGFVPARNWKLCESKDGRSVTMSITVPEEHATVEQTVSVQPGETVLYISDTITGAEGAYPVGFHPTLRIPEQIGSAIVDLSDYARCITAPTHIEDPAKGGYCALPKDYEVTDETAVPTVYGEMVNLKQQPFTKGFDDIYMYVFDQSHDFDYGAISVPSEGYLYFQLKNPAQLSNSMIWTSYCGRHYAPWNGRVNGCIELGAATNYFFYGLPGANSPDPLTEAGFVMHHTFDGSPRTYKLICGVVEIPSDYPGVASITKKDDKTIVITGRDGSVIETACQVDFLR